jgi:hypothetical protein
MGTVKRSAFVQVRPMRRFSEDHQMKDEALKLASALDHWATQMDMGRKPDPKSLIRKASAELRRLQAELDAIKQALAAQPAPVQEPVALLNGIKRYEPEIFREDRIRMELEQSGEWVKYADVELLIATPPAQPAPVQEPLLNPLSKKWKWVLHGSFADVAGFEEDGIPSFYWQESATKFKSGELSAPCKGKNCGSMNGWLHSVECRAEHEAQYTTPPAQPAPVQERTDYAVHLNHCNIGECEGVCKYGDDDCPALKHADMKAKWDRPTPPAAAVPDAFGTREGEHPQYIQGWNDCRQAMLEMMK